MPCSWINLSFVSLKYNIMEKVDLTSKLSNLFDTSFWSEQDIKNYYSLPVWTELSAKINMTVENIRGHVKTLFEDETSL